MLLRLVTIAVAIVLAAGEIARWWGDARILPMAFDELLVSAALLGGVLAQHRLGTAPLAAAWGLFCGLILGLLVPTLDHLLFGPPKESAAFYAAVLGVMLAVGLWGTARAIALARTTTRLG